MTLAISFFDSNVEDVDEGFRGMAEMPGDLFGFETWRGVWGSTEILHRGGNFLSKLKNGDLYICPDDLNSFKEELELIYAESEEISQKLKVNSEDMKFRLNNAIEACGVAKTKGYGLCIS